MQRHLNRSPRRYFPPRRPFLCYNFSSEGLQKTAKSVVACCVVNSSADIKEVDHNTLRVLVNQFFETSDLSLRKAIYGELRDALFYSKNPECIASLREAQRENQEKMKEWQSQRLSLLDFRSMHH
ncbi:hypothetical protein FALCPG4_012632 [Fusarium falciforme]